MQTFNIEKNETQCVVTWRHHSGIVVKWLIFLVFWSFFCLIPLDILLNGDILYGISLALVGWGGWFFVLGKIVNAFFGKTRFMLDSNGLESTWTCLSLKLEKRITLNELRCFSTQVNCGKATRWHRRLYVVCYTTDVGYLTTAGFLTQSSKELDDLCKQLNAFLETLKAASSVDAP